MTVKMKYRVGLILAVAYYAALLAGCGGVKNGTPEQVAAPTLNLPSKSSEDNVCARVRACNLSVESENEFCPVCVQWIERYLEGSGVDWTPYLDKVETTSCDDLKQLGKQFKFFSCINKQHMAWSELYE